MKRMNLRLRKIKKQLNILWVDDNDAIRTNASLMLEMMGHQTHTATSGKQAIQLLCNTISTMLYLQILVCLK